MLSVFLSKTIKFHKLLDIIILSPTLLILSKNIALFSKYFKFLSLFNSFNFNSFSGAISAKQA